jgi:hypothetical protein
MTTDVLAPRINHKVGRGQDAVLVLTHARARAGDPAFCGSAAECVRLAAIKLDLPPHNAAMLLAAVRPPERMMQRIEDEPPGFRKYFRERMLTDFDGAIAKLGDLVESRRAWRARTAVRDARNWANAKPTEARQAELARTFEAAHDEAKRAAPDPAHIYVKAPRPVAPVIISTGSGSRGTK